MRNQRPAQVGITHYALLIVLAIFVAISVLYSLTVPLFEGPDEIWHYAFADHLANGGGLPVFDANTPATFLRNGAHPPLYYALMAILIAPIDRADFPAEFHFNLANPLITPGAHSDRPNLLIHTAREDWPWRNTTLAAHLARFVSIVLGAITVTGVWHVTQRLLKDDRLALIATTLVACVPQFIYGTALINNDALAAAATTWFVYALIRLKNRVDLKWAVISGGWLGLALLSKIGMIALLPVPVLALVLCAPGNRQYARQSWRRLLTCALIIYGIAFAIAGWWYIRNWQLYRDPLAWREWQALTGAGRVPPTPFDFVRDMIGLFGTFWLDLALRLDRTWWPLFGAIVLVALIGLGRRAIKREWPALDWSGLLIGLSVFGLLLASAVRYSLNIYDIHGRLLYPALAAIGGVLALGLTGWPRSKWIVIGALGVIGAISLVAPFAIIQPAYARPIMPGLPDDATKTTAHFDDVELIGYQLRPEHINAGEAVHMTTYWRRAKAAEHQTSLRVVLALTGVNSGDVLGRVESVLGTDAYPSWAWQANEIVATETNLTATTGVSAAVEVRLGARGETATLIPSESGESIGLGRVIVRAAQACEQPLRSREATFGGSIKLLGYRLEPDTVVLCWQSIASTPIDYTVFVHLTDKQGEVLTADGPPRDGAYPASAWAVGEQVEDRHPLPIGSDVIKKLSIGLYRLDTGERLTIDGTNETELQLLNEP